MKWNKILSYIGYFMKWLNLLIILFISITMAYSTYLISNSSGSREFLEQIPTLPMKPNLTVIISIITYIVLLIIMQLKEKQERKRLGVIILFSTMELALCSVVLYALNMSYNGIILVVIADIIYHVKDRNNKLIFLSIMIIIYILCDYDFVSLKFSMVSFSKYLVYYNTRIQNYILGLKSMLTSINIMSFILYVIILMRIQSDENERIKILNDKLNKANSELKIMNIKLKDYASKTEKMTETRERNRLAREIHDTIGHSLTGIIAGIDACSTIIDYSPEGVKKQLDVIRKVAKQGINDVRRSVKALRPDVLENLSFEEAIEKMIFEIRDASKCNIILENQMDDLKFDSDEEDAIYRVIQESITNAIRHGHATKVYVTIYKRENDLVLIVTDNGIGCEKIESGFGLQHMKERVELLNGSIEFSSKNGFTIIANIPIRRGDIYGQSIDC